MTAKYSEVYSKAISNPVDVVMTSKSVFYSFRKKFRRSSNSSSVAESNDFADNGLILSKVYLPPELIERILCSADDKTVLRCQRVCKRWNEIIKDYVWRKKAELKIGCQLSSDDSMDWRKFYVICAKIGRNLVKNHSGAEGHKYWENIRGHRFGWKIECPPIGAPKLSKDPEFKKDQHCFAGTYYDCYQQYTIDLIKEGFPAKIFDQQSPPPIEASYFYYSLRRSLLKSYIKAQSISIFFIRNTK